MISFRCATCYIDTLLQLLDSKTSLVQGVHTQRELQPSALRRLLLKLAITHNILPTAFYLKDVSTDGQGTISVGAFADIYCGNWNGRAVALKLLRPAADSSEEELERSKKRVCVLFLMCLLFLA